jgi:hypothetical protein
MAADPASEIMRWVREGESLFAQTLKALHRSRELELTAGEVAQRNQALQQEIRVLREELRRLREERLETAEMLKNFAEHVTQLATLVLQGMVKRAG